MADAGENCENLEPSAVTDILGSLSNFFSQYGLECYPFKVSSEVQFILMIPQPWILSCYLVSLKGPFVLHKDSGYIIYVRIILNIPAWFAKKKWGQHCLQCNECEGWFHVECTSMPVVG